MDRLSPLDATFLEAEDADRHTSMAIASIAIFDGPAPEPRELAEAYAARLPLVPRYRQRLRRLPVDLGPPVWVDDPDFDIEFHLRRTALPAPGGVDELNRLMGRVMAQRLDRDRPLWETWMVEGLTGSQWALISKVHHCMVDGISGTELYHLLLSASPEWDGATVVAPPDQDVRTTSGAALALDAITQLALIPARELALVGTAVRHPGRSVATLFATMRGSAALLRSATPAAQSQLSGTIGQQRRYAWQVVALDEVKRAAHRHDATVNDVALAAITGGFRALLLDDGESCRDAAVRSLVPVSTRLPGEEGRMANLVSCLLVDLPVEIEDPLERLHVVRDRVRAARADKEPEAGALVAELAGYQPFPALAPALRAAFRLPQHSLATVTTNVPGPREPLYLMGRRLRRLLPYVPIADRVRTGVAILSYCDELAFGVTADYAMGHRPQRLLQVVRLDLQALSGGTLVSGAGRCRR